MYGHTQRKKNSDSKEEEEEGGGEGGGGGEMSPFASGYCRKLLEIPLKFAWVKYDTSVLLQH